MTIENHYYQAELSLASYASLVTGNTNSLVNFIALQQGGDGMSSKQAEEFSNRYPYVIEQYYDTLSEGGMGTKKGVSTLF